jgi:TolA-binding protein
VGTIQDRFQKIKTVMVTTRSTQNAGAPPQGTVNAEVPPRQTPDVATLQATIERMQRDMEELQRINATLRQQTGNGEEHSSHNRVNDNQGGGPEPSNHLSENQGGDPEPSIQG